MEIIEDCTPNDLIQKINQEFFLPPIQRKFVWSMEKIETFFDSLYFGYPVGVPIVWKIKKWDAEICSLYHFQQQAGIGVEGFDPANEAKPGKEYNVVLDGQQRLTSLFIGRKGWINSKRKGRGLHNRNNIEKLYLCFNLLGDDNKNFKKSIDDEEEEIPLFKFKTEEECCIRKKNNFWVRVKDVCDSYDKGCLSEFVRGIKSFFPKTFIEQKKLLDGRIKNLTDVIYEASFPYFEVDFETMNETTEVFSRVNSKGTELTKAELMYSRIVAEWPKGGKDFVDSETKMLKDEMSLSRPQDFVMRSMLYLNDLPVRYNLEAFNTGRIRKIKNQENKASLEESLSSLVDRKDRFCYAKGLSENALLPIAYYLKKKGKIDKESEWEEIKKYYIISQTFGLFSGNSDSTLSHMRNVIKKCIEDGKPFSIKYLKKQNECIDIKQFFDVKKKDLLDFLEEPIYDFNKGLARLLLGVIRKDKEIDEIIAEGQLDHIHPASTITDDDLSDRKNSLLNLELLSGKLNRKKTDCPFIEFMKNKKRFPATPAGRKKRDKFLDDHLIPKQKALWTEDNYNLFWNKRKKSLYEKLKKWYNL